MIYELHPLLYPLLYALLYALHSTLYSLFSILHTLLLIFTLLYPLYTLFTFYASSPTSPLYSLLYLLFTLLSVQCSLCPICLTFYSALYSALSAPSALYSLLSTLYIRALAKVALPPSLVHCAITSGPQTRHVPLHRPVTSALRRRLIVDATRTYHSPPKAHPILTSSLSLPDTHPSTFRAHCDGFLFLCTNVCPLIRPGALSSPSLLSNCHPNQTRIPLPIPKVLPASQR